MLVSESVSHESKKENIILVYKLLEKFIVNVEITVIVIFRYGLNIIHLIFNIFNKTFFFIFKLFPASASNVTSP